MELSRLSKTSPWYQCLVVCCLVSLLLIFGFAIFINIVATIDVTDGLDDWFLDGNDLSTDRYQLDISPEGFTFAIWGLIYLWQLAWIVYVLTSLCRRNQDGTVFIFHPPIITPFFLLVGGLHYTFNILWFFLFDNELLSWTLVCLFLMFVTLEICRVSAHLSVDKYGQELRQEHNNDLWTIRILIHNGLALYSAWTVVATVVSLGIVMTYEGDVSQSASSTACLVIIAFYLIVTFILETIVWDRYFRYTFANWGVYIWSLIGIFVSDWSEPHHYNQILSVVILVLAIFLLAVKIPIVIWRHRSKPLYS